MRCQGSRIVALVAALAVAGGLAGCSSSGSDDAADTTTSAREGTTTTAPAKLSASVHGEDELPGTYRQGVARSGDGWVFVTNDAIYRTDDRFEQTDVVQRAIPDELRTQGYDHLGDPDVHDGMIWIPVERPDKSQAAQVTARYDEETLEYVDSFAVRQHHNSFVTVDDDGIAYSTDEFSDHAIVRYRVRDGEAVDMEPLELSTAIDRIQGGDVLDGALWLSTDDDHNGVYRVDLASGRVTPLGSAGHIQGEGEGIDATEVGGDQLHVLVADEAIVPMWLVHLRVVEEQ